MSEMLGGYRVSINKAVPPGRQVIFPDAYMIAFHDRADLMAALFWANIMPRLRKITYDSWVEWKAIRTPAAAPTGGR